MSLPPALEDALRRFAGHRSVLVATDFDGALAPLVDDPLQSRPVIGAMNALHALADLPGTTVALVSGRALDQLSGLSGARESVVLIGSHGAEDSRRTDGLALTPGQQQLLGALADDLAGLRRDHPGVRVEDKPAGRVVHTRGMPATAGERALAAALQVGERHPDLVVTPGKDVVELAVTRVDKGSALLALARDLGVDAVLFAGDDLTDEHGFRALAQDPDADRALRRLTVRVGPGATAAQHRVEDEPALVEVFRLLGSARSGRRGGAPQDELG